jgi:hypothetical protein
MPAKYPGRSERAPVDTSGEVVPKKVARIAQQTSGCYCCYSLHRLKMAPHF